MQVKKFEARTMKDALELVKTQLGPDAIILSARDNNRSFGLVGEGSVEITAAVSEQTLQKKKFVESRLKDTALQQFQNSPARMQKDVIEKMVNKHIERNTPQQVRPVTTTRYIDIDEPVVKPMNASQVNISPVSINSVATSPIIANNEVASLKAEIAGLREIITQFQSIPQTVSQGTHPGADYGLSYDMSFMYERLLGAGVAPEIAADLLSQAQNELPPVKAKNRSAVEGWVARRILEAVPIDNEISSKMHVFIGPSGTGKTSSLVKLASHLVVNEGKRIALITTDTGKVGAADQMRIYAQILNVPFAIVRSQADWSAIMKYLNGVDAVLVDFQGMSLKTSAEVDRLRSLMPPGQMKARIHFVLSANMKDQDVVDSTKRYSVIGFHDAIFNSLDESIQHGTIFNFTQRFRVPLHSFGIGTRIPEDFEFASKERVLDLILKITDAQRQQGANL